MNLDDRNIDQIFRDAAQNASAPNYDSTYWNEVSSILDADSKKKKFLLIWSLGGSLAVILLFSLLFSLNGTVKNRILYTQVQSESISVNKHSLNSSEFKIASRSDKDASHQGSHSSESKRKNSFYSNFSNNQDSFNESKSNSSPIISSQQKELVSKDRINESRDLVSAYRDVNSIKQSPLNESMRSLAIKQLEFDNQFKSNLLNGGVNRNWNLALELDAGIMENYKTSRPFESGLFSIAVKGIYKNSNLIFSTGVGLQVSTNSDLVVSQRAKFYGFGVVNYQTDLSYQNMYDVYIPVELGYKLGKTSFGMGLQANYLINTSMLMQKYEDFELMSSENISGFSNGLNKFSTQGYVWIYQQLGDQLSVGLKLGTSFSNRIKEGDYFNESATTNPVFGQVSIRYNIFK